MHAQGGKGVAPAPDIFTFFVDVDDVAACVSSAVALGPDATRSRHILVSKGYVRMCALIFGYRSVPNFW